jgi:hypothetical protein
VVVVEEVMAAVDTVVVVAVVDMVVRTIPVMEAAVMAEGVGIFQQPHITTMYINRG